MFSFSSCGVSGFTCRSLIYLELVFVQGDRYGYNFVLLPVEFSFSKTISEDAPFSLLNAFFSLLNIRGLWSQVSSLGSFISLVHMSVVPVLLLLLYYYCNISEDGMVIPPAFFFLIRIILFTQNILWFHNEF